jgi:hypothetical protein
VDDTPANPAPQPLDPTSHAVITAGTIAASASFTAPPGRLAADALARAVDLVRVSQDVLAEQLCGAPALATAATHRQTGPGVPAALLAASATLAKDLAVLVTAVTTHMQAGVPGPLRHTRGADPTTALHLAAVNTRNAVAWLREAADDLTAAHEHLAALTAGAAR